MVETPQLAGQLPAQPASTFTAIALSSPLAEELGGGAGFSAAFTAAAAVAVATALLGCTIVRR